MKNPRSILLPALLGAALLGVRQPAARGDDAASPFVGEFSGSPIHWTPWGDGAFARAKKENLPVYVFIGSVLSEPARTTESQSFSNPDTAAFFNAHFVCVLVDRDERPDIAAAAQQYLDQIKQLSGWPVHLWLTPDLRPFDGANYLGPTQEWGQQSLMQVATRAADSWRIDAKGCSRTSLGQVAALRRARMAPGPIDSAKLAAALQAAAQDWRTKYDPAHGGFGDAPRYPQPELLRFLIKRGSADRDLALAALKALASGALRDTANGGFYRYRSDTDGRTPYPQKTLQDQARLVLAYVDAQQSGADPVFADAIRTTLGYVLGHLARRDGTFSSSEDGTGDKPLVDTRAAADANGLLLAALARAGGVLGDSSTVEAARSLGGAARLRFIRPGGDVSHFADQASLSSPGDYAALALGFRALAVASRDDGCNSLADRLLARCDQLFLVPGAGNYAASPAVLPKGVFARSPASLLADQNPAPEAIALLAGPAPSTGDALGRGLVRALILGDGNTGDALLALASISP
jgi:uncharacterized protein YyaL (SSP411 family)